MARIRLTYFFKSVRGYGWTETFFSTRGTLTAALLDAKALLPLRVNMLGTFSSCPYIRVSDDEQKRDSQIYSVPSGDQTGKLPDLGSSDIANTCLLLRIEATDFVRRSLALRGIPDNIVLDSGAFVPTAVFTTALAAYVNAIKAGAFAVRSREPIGATADFLGIGNMTANGDVTIVCTLPHGWLVGNQINITEVTGATQVRGVHKILAVPTAESFTINIKRVMKAWTGGGKAYRLGYALNAITNALPIRVSHRNAGRPFDAPRGRRLVS